MLVSITGHSQTLAGWLKQKKTQRKYLLEQIAALQVYLEYTRKGYDIIKDGTELIGDIKNGDFNLHKDYFNSLETVKPEIRDADQVQDIIKMHSAMVKSRAATLKFVTGNKFFSAAEVASIKKLYDRLADEAEKDLQELKMLTEDGRLKLKDDERILRIDKIYKRMQGKYSLQLQTDTKIRALAGSRKKEQQNLDALKKLYGL